MHKKTEAHTLTWSSRRSAPARRCCHRTARCPCCLRTKGGSGTHDSEQLPEQHCGLTALTEAVPQAIAKRTSNQRDSEANKRASNDERTRGDNVLAPAEAVGHERALRQQRLRVRLVAVREGEAEDRPVQVPAHERVAVGAASTRQRTQTISAHAAKN